MCSLREGESPVVETKDGFTLVRRHASADSYNILVKVSSHELKVAEDEGLLGVETDSDDILCILFGEANNVVNAEIRLEEEFLVVGQHDDQRNIEDVL